jgi:hypothetical protein
MIVGVTVVPDGLAQLISPVSLLIDMPAGELLSEKVYGYAPPTTTARMLYGKPG